MSPRLQDLKNALILHATKYPKMRPCDAVKLIYQASFGCGHLIKKPEDAFERLASEYQNTIQRVTAPLTEPIGGGFVRVNLSALDANGVSVGELFEAFVKSCEVPPCSKDGFLSALELLKELSREGLFRFSFDELSEYILRYEEMGCPAVSHSEDYRTAYDPAYRVVYESLFNSRR